MLTNSHTMVLLSWHAARAGTRRCPYSLAAHTSHLTARAGTRRCPYDKWTVSVTKRLHHKQKEVINVHNHRQPTTNAHRQSLATVLKPEKLGTCWKFPRSLPIHGSSCPCALMVPAC